ncbi:MAG TPA: glycosyltransferase family 39 protein, partial [Aggregatilineaceae bacterium]|nr:glycosyltransferase family 39 protein [Aggregatilineaceae bacterium]
FMLIYLLLDDPAAAMSYGRVWLLAAVVGVVGISLIRVYGLAVYPTMHSADEPWVLSHGVSVAETSKLTDPMIPERDIPLNYFAYALGAWLRVVGIGLWEARLFTFLLTFVVITLTGLAAGNLYGRRTALLTAAFLVCSATLMSAARIRHDIGLAVMLAASLWVYSLALRREQRGLHLLAGLLMGWGMFAHYNATGLGVAAAASLYGPRYMAGLKQDKRWPEAGLWLYGLGGLIGAGTVMLTQMLPYLDTFFKNNSPEPVSLEKYLDTFFEYLTLARQSSQLEVLLISAGAAAAMWRQRVEDWTIASMLVLGPLALTVIAPNANPLYIVPLTPFYGLAFGSMIGEGWRQNQTTQTLRRGPAAAAILILAANLGLTLRPPLDYVRQRGAMRPDAPAPAQWILDHVDQDATLAGEHYYYLWLTDYDYISPMVARVDLQGSLANSSSEAELWDALHPDYFIIDGGRTSYPILRDLIQSGYLDARGYEVVMRSGAVTIYGKVSPE